MDKSITINPERETSGYVEVFTTILPFILLAIIVVIIIAMFYTVMIVKRYLADDKMSEQQRKSIHTDIQEIKERLDRMERDFKKQS